MALTKQTEIADWAFITPSYSGDYQRCVLLCRSMDAFLSGNWKHYVVVDKPHYAMFRHLEGPRRSVLITDEVLPGNMRLLFHMPFARGRSVWWSKSAGVSIGWHLQQMVKIGIASHLQEAGLVYCDSDTFFLKPFDVKHLTQDGKFRLFRTHYKAKVAETPNPAYTRAALEMLEISPAGEFYGYVDNFVTWRRKSVLQLQQRLGHKYDGEWRRAFRNRMKVSEYNLYGLFIDNLTPTEERHFHTSQFLCKTHWFREAMTPDQVISFCGNLAPHEVMVGFQSFVGVDVALLEQQFEAALKNRNAR